MDVVFDIEPGRRLLIPKIQPMNLVDQGFQMVRYVFNLICLMDMSILVGRVEIIAQLVDFVSVFIELNLVFGEVLQVFLEVPRLPKRYVIQTRVVRVSFHLLNSLEHRIHLLVTS